MLRVEVYLLKGCLKVAVGEYTTRMCIFLRLTPKKLLLCQDCHFAKGYFCGKVDDIDS